ncbi:sulfur carrier protein ThiS [Geobacillus sp. C56-T3]|uniref:sulfur carrier protein ThiS n=1 Tax=Geobacillus sp. (strain C56-T3) TaxID=691437 RepID=UPI0001D58396|nr:sulfur carrier protein ThiS [Geobacillus sp. C56-T3]ADI27878.1 thiamine biosynthesis protein ThiS [Geobacillus sp. C56-T3]
MTLVINGEAVAVPDEVKTVGDLLAYFRLENKLCIVEVNVRIIQKHEYETTALCDGDRVEIVHFVGGG